MSLYGNVRVYRKISNLPDSKPLFTAFLNRIKTPFRKFFYFNMIFVFRTSLQADAAKQNHRRGVERNTKKKRRKKKILATPKQSATYIFKCAIFVNGAFHPPPASAPPGRMGW